MKVYRIAGKHIACKCPSKSDSQYFNYKGFYSVVLMAFVGADTKFIWEDLCGTGSASDAQISKNSEIKEFAENVNIGFPALYPLPNDNQDVPYFFIGDDAFALRETMVNQYSLRGLDNEERIFNCRPSRARRIVENAFDILANRFQILLTTMQYAGLQLAYAGHMLSYASHTQSMLAIRWSHASHTLTYAGHALSYASHTQSTLAIG